MSYIYKNKETGKIEVKVPVCYQVNNLVSMEFDSIEDMHNKLNDAKVIDEMPLGDEPYYIDGSFEVDMDSLNQFEEEFNSK